MLGYAHILELADGRYYADATRSIEARAMAGYFVPDGELDAGLRDYFRSFDLVISYLFDPDEVFANNVRRCGVRQYIAGTPRVTERPAAAHYCRPLESLAIYVEQPRPRVFPNDADRRAAERFLEGIVGPRLAAVHPGSGGPRKNWPPEKFAVVAKWLMDSRSAPLLVVAGEADAEAAAALERLLAGRSFHWVRGLRLPELAAVLQRCAVYVGNDSGITHLAAAVGAPTVAVFGPHSSPLWKPVGEHVRVVAMGAGDDEFVRAAVEEIMVA